MTYIEFKYTHIYLLYLTNPQEVLLSSIIDLQLNAAKCLC